MADIEKAPRRKTRSTPRSKPLSDGDIRRALGYRIARCPTCDRPVRHNFVRLGLAYYKTTHIETPDGTQSRTVAPHSYPCVGLPSASLQRLIHALVEIATGRAPKIPRKHR